MITWNGNKLKKAREEKRWSRMDMACAWWDKFNFSITTATISNWEDGGKPPGRINLIRLTDLFEKPIEYFFDGKSTRKPKTEKPRKKMFGLI